MANSVNFLHADLNTSLNSHFSVFKCFCGWTGFITELASKNSYSCCPTCGEYDVRMDFESIKMESES